MVVSASMGPSTGLLVTKSVSSVAGQESGHVMLPPFRVDMLAARHVHDGSLGFPASISDHKIGHFCHSGESPGFESTYWSLPSRLVCPVGPSDCSGRLSLVFGRKSSIRTTRSLRRIASTSMAAIENVFRGAEILESKIQQIPAIDQADVVPRLGAVVLGTFWHHFHLWMPPPASDLDDFLVMKRWPAPFCLFTFCQPLVIHYLNKYFAC